jgi:hypothetical protein
MADIVLPNEDLVELAFVVLGLNTLVQVVVERTVVFVAEDTKVPLS